MDKQILKKIFNDSQSNGSSIVGVIHLAGLKSVADSLSNPMNYWDVNVLGSINLLQAMETFGCKAFVFSSSATVYLLIPTLQLMNLLMSNQLILMGKQKL